jgi:alanine racemase
LLARERILQAVFSAPYARALSAALAGVPLGIHLKTDGGLCREGFDPKDKRGMATALAQKNLRLQGVFTHFPVADTDPESTRHALGEFLTCRRWLQREEGPVFAHAAASAALLTQPEAVLDAARAGLLLYGLSPVKTALPLRPALSLFAPIQQIRTVKKGTPVGYGGDFVTSRESRIGTLPIGYGDGLCRRMSGASVTLLHKKSRFSVPICGRISMDMTTVDLTDTPAREGDTVCLFESADAPADRIGSIPYEVLTALSPRIERQYVSNFQEHL